MDVEPTGGPGETPFEAKPGTAAWIARLHARAEETRASCGWRRSLDGVRSVGAATTVQAGERLSGWLAATRVGFRHRAASRAATGLCGDERSLCAGRRDKSAGRRGEEGDVLC